MYFPVMYNTSSTYSIHNSFKFTTYQFIIQKQKIFLAFDNYILMLVIYTYKSQEHK